MLKITKILAVLLAVTALVVNVTPAMGGDFSWSPAGGDLLWSNAANWTGPAGLVPGLGDIARFDGNSAAAGVTTVELDRNEVVTQLFIQTPTTAGWSETLDLNGFTLDVANDEGGASGLRNRFTTEADADLTLTGGGTLTSTGNLLWCCGGGMQQDSTITLDGADVSLSRTYGMAKGANSQINLVSGQWYNLATNDMRQGDHIDISGGVLVMDGDQTGVLDGSPAPPQGIWLDWNPVGITAHDGISRPAWDLLADGSDGDLRWDFGEINSGQTTIWVSASSTPTFTSILTGTWDTVGTWDEGSTIPAIANPVVIADGHVVTIASAEANADAESVSVEGTGQLVVESPRILGVASAVAIGPNATLSGDGQIIPTEVEVEGTIAAGASAGTLTIGAFGAGDLTLTATSTLKTEVGDLVDVAGAVTVEAGASLALDDPGIIDDKLDPRIGQKTQIVLQGASVTGSFGSNVPTAGDTPGSGLYAGTPTHDGGGTLTGFTGPVVTENAADVQLTAFQALAGDSNLDSLVDVNDRIIWNSNKFTSGKTWLEADWTGEGDVDVNDRIKWNTNKFTDYTSAAAAGLAGEALAAAVGPEFVYDALTGELSVITNGHYMTDMIVNFTGDQSAADPVLLDNNFFQNDLAANVFYDGQWFAGSWQLFDSFSNGDNGDSEPNGAATNPDGQMLLLTGLPLGLTAGDFGAASWGDFDGAAGAGEVTIVVPEPGTLLLLLAGFCGLLLWRRR